MNSIVLEKITKTFDTRMEEIRNNMENEIKNNIQKSLAQLLRDLSKNGH
jgi:predicted small metal-binding protein